MEPEIAKIAWGRKGKDGAYRSKCGRFVICGKIRWSGPTSLYKVEDLEAGDSATRSELADAKRWASEWPLRAWPRVYYTYREPLPAGRTEYIYLDGKPGKHGSQLYKVTVEKVSPDQEKS